MINKAAISVIEVTICRDDKIQGKKMKYLKGKNNSVYSNTREKTPSKSEEEHTKEREPKETRRDDKETTSSDKDGDWHDLDKEWETFTNEWSNTQKDYGSEDSKKKELGDKVKHFFQTRKRMFESYPVV